MVARIDVAPVKHSHVPENHWPWLSTACPRLMEIEEDVFESLKDHENEIPVVVLVGIRVGFAIRAFVSFRRWPRTLGNILPRGVISLVISAPPKIGIGAKHVS